MTEPLEQDYAVVVGNSLQWGGPLAITGGDLLTPGTVVRCTVRHPYTRAVLTQLVGVPGDSSGGITIVDGSNYKLKFTPAMTATWPVHKPGCPYDVQVSRGSSKSITFQFGRVQTERGITLSRSIAPTYQILGSFPQARAAYSSVGRLTDAAGPLLGARRVGGSSIVPITADAGVNGGIDTDAITALAAGAGVDLVYWEDQSGYQYSVPSVGNRLPSAGSVAAVIAGAGGALNLVGGSLAIGFPVGVGSASGANAALRLGNDNGAWDPAYLYGIDGLVGDFTWAAALRWDTVGGWGFHFGEIFAGYDRIGIRANSSTTLRIALGGAGDYVFTAPSLTTLHRYVLRKSGTTMQCWIDGTLVDSRTVGSALNIQQSAYASIVLNGDSYVLAQTATTWKSLIFWTSALPDVSAFDAAFAAHLAVT